MKRIITIEDISDGRVAITVTGEERIARGSKAIRAFDLIMPALENHFRPMKTYFKPMRGARGGG